jgi:hypothetical protein
MKKVTVSTNTGFIEITKIDHEDDVGGNSNITEFIFNLDNQQYPFTKIDVERAKNGDPKFLKLKFIGTIEADDFVEAISIFKS